MKTVHVIPIIVCCVFAIVAFAVFAVVGAGARCHHDGRLESIDLDQTWRVNITTSIPTNKADVADQVIIGVCKHCGQVTDVEGSGTGWYSRIPIAGSRYLKADDAPKPKRNSL